MNYTLEEQYNMIKKDPFNLACIDNQYEEVCLQTVKKYGMALRWVEHQTEEICLEAVKKTMEWR